MKHLLWMLVLLFCMSIPARAQNPNPCSQITNTATSGQVLSAVNGGNTPPCKWVTGGGGGGATIPNTTNIIKGDGAGNGADSGYAAQNASASLTGFLTSIDWSTFNSKVSATRTINTTSPLTGGGDLSADRTFACATCLTGNQTVTLSGDTTGSGATAITTVTAKVNGVSSATSPANHTVQVVTASNTRTDKVVPDCTDTGGNHINFTQSTDAFSCGTSNSGGVGWNAPAAFASISSCTNTQFYQQVNNSFYDKVYCDGASTLHYYILGTEVFLPGAASGWTVVNGASGTAALTDNVGAVTLSTASDVIGFEAALKAVPGGAYIKTFKFSAIFDDTDPTNTIQCGVIWTNGTATSSSFQDLFVGITSTASLNLAIAIQHFTSFAFAGGATDFSAKQIINTGNLFYMALQDDTTNRKFWISADGVGTPGTAKGWVLVFSTTRTTPFTPTNYGFGCGKATSGTGIPWAITVVSLQ